MKFQQVMAFFLTGATALSMGATALAADVSTDTASAEHAQVMENHAEPSAAANDPAPDDSKLYENE